MAKVVIEFDAADDASSTIKKIVGETNKLDSATAKASKSTKTASGNFTELNSALALGRQALQYINQGLDATSGATVKYANEVRSLTQISGASAEESSRLIQVLDDYKVSVTDITQASKKLKDQGLTPTVDTLAQLSDEYLKIKDPAEKLKFVQDNLGKSGQKWIEILNQGSAAIKKQGAAVSDNLILSQKQLDAARKLEIAEDSLNDARQATAVTLGNKIIPLQTDFYNGVNVLIRGLEIAKERHIGLAEATDIAGREIFDEQQAMIKLNDATGATEEGLDSLSDSQDAAADSAKQLSDIYTGLLSSMFSIQGANDSYQKTIEDITKKDEELANKKSALTLEMWKEQQAGKMTNDENLRYVQQLSEITEAQAENTQARLDAEEENKKASDQRVYDLAQQKLAVDGIISSGEYEYLQDLAVNYGLISRASADAAIAEDQRANQLVANFEQGLPPMERSLQVMQQIAAFNGQRVNFGVNFQSNLPASANSIHAPANPSQYQYMSNTNANRNINYRDSGGSGIAGTPYMIGTGAQPEMFVPNQNGQFIPNADKGMGATYNIVINNPKPEKSEASIRGALKKLSYIGVAS